MASTILRALDALFTISALIAIITAFGNYYIALSVVPRIDKTRNKPLNSSFFSRNSRVYEYYFSFAAPVFLMRLIGEDIECKVSRSDLRLLQINTGISLFTFILTAVLMYLLKYLE